jgi:hypothetical protein
MQTTMKSNKKMTMNNVNRKYLLPVFLFFSLNPAFAQSVNYTEIFGEDWNKAVTFEKENRIWMEPILAKNHISYPLAVSIIFPELVRYSVLRDKMEITLLKTLYVNLGEDYANFSIGVFQMKPSFAEIIREKAPEIKKRISGIKLKSKTDFKDIKACRKSIVKDLEEPVTQMNYLILFIRICEKKFHINLREEDSSVKFLATAYNYGIDKDSTEIESMIDKKFFNTKLFKTENYSYSDVSLFWYEQFLKTK